jgi:hypothetical protein
MKRIAVLAATVYAVAIVEMVAPLPAMSAKPPDGQQIFRFDTFDDEQLWTDTLRMQEPIATVSPNTALSVGLKVDAEALPPPLVAALQAGQVDLNDAAVTIELLRLNAVVGVIGKVDDNGQLTQVGITCGCVTRRSTIHSLPASASGWMDGRIVT